MGVPLSEIIDPEALARLRAVAGDGEAPEDDAPPDEEKAVTGELERKSDPIAGATQVLTTNEKTGQVRAVVSATGLEDRVKDVIEPGAYTKSIAKQEPIGVWSHDDKTWVARAESYRELMPGDPEIKALDLRLADGSPWPAHAGAVIVDAQFNLETPHGAAAFSDVKFFKGKTSWSIGYRATKAHRNPRTGVRHIKELDWFEFSPVMVGANQHAMTLSVKSLAQPVDPDDATGLVEPDAPLLDSLSASELFRYSELKGDLEPLDHDAPESLEHKGVRRVRTAEGARRFGVPIGTIIRPDGSPVSMPQGVRSGSGPTPAAAAANLSEGHLRSPKVGQRVKVKAGYGGDLAGKVGEIIKVEKYQTTVRFDDGTSKVFARGTGIVPDNGGSDKPDKPAADKPDADKPDAGPPIPPPEAARAAMSTPAAAPARRPRHDDDAAQKWEALDAEGFKGTTSVERPWGKYKVGDEITFSDGDKGRIVGIKDSTKFRNVSKFLVETNDGTVISDPQAWAPRSRGGEQGADREDRENESLMLQHRAGTADHQQPDPPPRKSEIEELQEAIKDERLVPRARAQAMERLAELQAKPKSDDDKLKPYLVGSQQFGSRAEAEMHVAKLRKLNPDLPASALPKVEKRSERTNPDAAAEGRMAAGLRKDAPAAGTKLRSIAGGEVTVQPDGSATGRTGRGTTGKRITLTAEEVRELIKSGAWRPAGTKSLEDTVKLDALNRRRMVRGLMPVMDLPLEAKDLDLATVTDDELDDLDLSDVELGDPNEVKGSGASLDRSPRKNWVENAGELPRYIREVARAIERGGMPLSRAIPAAIGRIKKWARGGGDVNADTRAKAAKAVAEWEALKLKAKAKFDSELLEHLEAKTIAAMDEAERVLAEAGVEVKLFAPEDESELDLDDDEIKALGDLMDDVDEALEPEGELAPADEVLALLARGDEVKSAIVATEDPEPADDPTADFADLLARRAALEST